MKKIFLLVSIAFCSGIMTGQKPVDYLMKGQALVRAGKADEAVGVLTDALAQYRESPVYLGRAEAFISKKEYSKAISDLNSANNITPASGEYGLARTYALKGDAATAVYHLELSLNSPFRKSEKEILLDPAFSLIDNKPEWRQFWKKEWYRNDEMLVSEIEYDVSANKLDEARAALSDLTGQYPGTASSSYGASLVAFAGGKYPDAVKELTVLVAKEPDNEKYLRLLAKAQESSGNQAGSSITYTKLLDSGIPDAELLLMRAECYRKTGETDKAIEDVGKYLGLYPDNQKALSFAGKIESAAGDNIRALEYFSRNLKLHPNDPQCYIDRANSYFVSKSWNWAIKDFSMSLDLEPQNPEVWLNKGIALLNMGNKNDACHDFRMAFGLGNKKATEYISRYCIK
ncbi:MAG: tetratricopeptide repeat protein [Bacteroidales bacterium]